MPVRAWSACTPLKRSNMKKESFNAAPFLQKSGTDICIDQRVCDDACLGHSPEYVILSGILQVCSVILPDNIKAGYMEY